MKKGEDCEAEEREFLWKRRQARKLLFLIGMLVILNFISLFAYANQKEMIDFNYDFKNYFNLPKINTNSSASDASWGTCADGTQYNTCSQEKPLFCYEGELLEKAFSCGCPEGFKINFQSCVEN